ncbi:sulfurtransferase TusA family protein [Burkholderia sp. Ac-20365]|uniref:sulfurtransferase TusA family protein n=1 Tax=Burkholderia sp. Ac-20365 TaxID=2703897 RepID=UPI003218057E
MHYENVPSLISVAHHRAPGSIMTTTDNSPASESDPTFDAQWDAGEMGCGELLLKLRKRLRDMPGQIIRLVAHDRGAIEDIPSYCRITGHQLLHVDPKRGIFLIKAKA